MRRTPTAPCRNAPSATTTAGCWPPAYIRDLRARGIPFERVRVLDTPAPTYQRWIFATTESNVAAGEDIRWLDRADAARHGMPAYDFYVFDEDRVAIMNFDRDGTLGGITVDDDPRHRRHPPRPPVSRLAPRHPARRGAAGNLEKRQLELGESLRRSRRAAAGEPEGALWATLTPRDRVVLELVAEHRVLTTEQLRALVFPSISRAQHRLLHLADHGVLWRTQPYRAEGGSKPFHYLLGYRGAQLRASQQGTTPPRPATHADRLRRVLESPRLGHLLGVNEFFAELADYSRRAGLGTFLVDERGFDREGLHTWRCEEWITEFYEL